MAIKIATVDTQLCVACGSCIKVCPKNAISVYQGKYAVASKDLCIGCGRCKKTCPAGVIDLLEVSVL